MHSRRRGSSGSTKPATANTDWVIYDADEVEEMVRKLHEEGHGPAEIGRILRDRYGVPDISDVADTSITDLLPDPEFPEDLQALMQRAVDIDEHLEEHPNDTGAKRNLALTEAKIRRLVDYYRGDEVPADWTYNIEKARLVVE